MRSLMWATVWMLLLTGIAWATETENLGIRILPAPGPVVVDGQFDDWDLSGGVFCCGDVENAREKMAVWFHLMYDQDNLYILTRWIDPTPLNNPGVTSGDMGFAGDSLQFRFITAPGTPDEKCTHVTAWRGRDGKDVVDLVFGRAFDQGDVRDAKTQGGSRSSASRRTRRAMSRRSPCPGSCWPRAARPRRPATPSPSLWNPTSPSAQAAVCRSRTSSSPA